MFGKTYEAAVSCPSGQNILPNNPFSSTLYSSRIAVLFTLSTVPHSKNLNHCLKSLFLSDLTEFVSSSLYLKTETDLAPDFSFQSSEYFTIDIVRKPSNRKCYTPPSETFPYSEGPHSMPIPNYRVVYCNFCMVFYLQITISLWTPLVMHI
jgi:hypothetical protein